MDIHTDNIKGIEFDGSAISGARKGRSISEIAEKVGISRQALWQIENGRVKPSASVLLRLCAALGLEAQDLASQKICPKCEVTLDR